MNFRKLLHFGGRFRTHLDSSDILTIEGNKVKD